MYQNIISRRDEEKRRKVIYINRKLKGYQFIINIYTPIKMSEGAIQQAIKKGNYIENECWINSLTDFYSDTIMNEKTRNRLTRDKIVELIGRENFSETGATIKEMEAVFKKFNIQVRIFNIVNEVIYIFEPEKGNHHIKAFYAMVNNNHIYTLNYDLSKIQQKQLITKLPTIKAHTDYYINEREEPPQYKMIKCMMIYPRRCRRAHSRHLTMQP